MAARSAPTAISGRPFRRCALARRYQCALPQPAGSRRAPSSYKSAAYRSMPANAHVSPSARHVAASPSHWLTCAGAPFLRDANAPASHKLLKSLAKRPLAVAFEVSLSLIRAAFFVSSSPSPSWCSARWRLQARYARAIRNRRSAFEKLGT